MENSTFKSAMFLLLFLIASNNTIAQVNRENKVWKKQESRIIVLDPEDTIKHHLKDLSPDSSLFGIIEHAVVTGRIPALDSAGNNINTVDLYGVPDTQTIYDPITNLEKIAVVHFNHLNSHISRFKLLLEWNFDRTSGNTTVRILKIAPQRLRTNFDETFSYLEDIFWINFSDISDILSSYEETHPDRSLALLLYKEYFAKEVKPANQDQ